MRRWRIVVGLTMVAVGVGAGCAPDIDWGEASVAHLVAPDGTEQLAVGIDRCADPDAELRFRERDEEVLLSIETGWTDGPGCTYTEAVVLEEPLGDRTVYLAGPALRYDHCVDEEGEPTVVPIDGVEPLCTDGNEQPVGIPDIDFELDIFGPPEE